MSQLDRIKALLEQAEPHVLLQTRDLINDRLEGEGTSGHGPTSPDASPDPKEQSQPSDEPIGQALEELNTDGPSPDAGDGTADGSYPRPEAPQTAPTSPEDKLQKADV